MSRPQTFECSRCKGPRDRGLEQRYCRRCHAAYVKEWRHRTKAQSDVSRETPAVDADVKHLPEVVR